MRKAIEKNSNIKIVRCKTDIRKRNQQTLHNQQDADIDYYKYEICDVEVETETSQDGSCKNDVILWVLYTGSCMTKETIQNLYFFTLQC